MEKVRIINGIQFINDSKGTNVGALMRAIESTDPPIILIAGGYDKGGDFHSLSPLIKEKVKELFLIGKATEKTSGQQGLHRTAVN